MATIILLLCQGYQYQSFNNVAFELLEVNLFAVFMCNMGLVCNNYCLYCVT